MLPSPSPARVPRLHPFMELSVFSHQQSQVSMISKTFITPFFIFFVLLHCILTLDFILLADAFIQNSIQMVHSECNAENQQNTFLRKIKTALA